MRSGSYVPQPSGTLLDSITPAQDTHGRDIYFQF